MSKEQRAAMREERIRSLWDALARFEVAK